MKFLADEDFPKPLVDKIRSLGFSVKTIQQKGLQGSSDEVVANLAIKERRIILTFDKDFLKKQLGGLQSIIFHFPKVPTIEIIPLIESFLKDLEQIREGIFFQKRKLFKGKILMFTKNGLEEQK